MAFKNLIEVKQLRKTAKIWRASAINVLIQRPIQEALGPESPNLLRLAQMAGVLAINSADGTASRSFSKHISQGVYFVPLTTNHHPDTTCVVRRSGANYDFPVGQILTKQPLDRSKRITDANHVYHPKVPEVSFVSFLDRQEYTAVNRAAIMTHELTHAHAFLSGKRKELPSPNEGLRLVLVEAPAYEAQFTVYDVCYGGLLSIITRNNIASFNPELLDFEVRAPDKNSADLINSSTSVQAALRTHMVNMVYGYNTASDTVPPNGLVNDYQWHFGHGDNQTAS